MSFTLESVVPWGRTYDEYTRMFDLDAQLLSRRILGCGDGPASFNATATENGYFVTSVDPIYAFSRSTLSRRIDETYDTVLSQVRANEEEFVWDHFSGPDDLGAQRMYAMQRFLDDFEAGSAEKRYITAHLPHLPFADDDFDIALCSHFLLLYSQQFDLMFHVDSALELLRVAPEARIFPLLELGSKPSRHLSGLLEALSLRGVSTEIRRVDYEFQRGGNEMLVLKR